MLMPVTRHASLAGAGVALALLACTLQQGPSGPQPSPSETAAAQSTPQPAPTQPVRSQPPTQPPTQPPARLQPAAANEDAAPAPSDAGAPAVKTHELCDEARCGPAPRYPTRLCPDGVHREGPGPCVFRAGSGCGWSRLTCPAPDQPEVIVSTDDPLLLLGSREPADRIRGAKLVRANRQGLALRERSETFAAPLAACLSFNDEEVRVWAVLALASLDDRVIPILERARTREASSRVNAQIDAVLKKPAPAPVTPPAACTKKNVKAMMKWPIRELCDPIGHYPPVLFSLSDGTHIYQGRAKGEACFRGRRKKQCHVKCLSGDTLIDTPAGPTAVRLLRAGDPVWSFDLSGRRVAQPIAAVHSQLASAGHQLVEVVLSDGRVVHGSGPHPTARGTLGDLRLGDAFDGAQVSALRARALEGERTYDLLPAGETGLYLAEGVILGSSLAPSSR